MIVRIATVWVLLATLVVCPFACLAESASAVAAVEVGHGCEVVDRCCAPCNTPAGDRDPGDRERSEQGGDCLCHGAVVADHASASERLPVPVFWDRQTPPASTGRALSVVDAAAENHACHFPNADSGRALRALIESFLL
jgi:hypothetical protein